MKSKTSFCYEDLVNEYLKAFGIDIENESEAKRITSYTAEGENTEHFCIDEKYAFSISVAIDHDAHSVIWIGHIVSNSEATDDIKKKKGG